MEYGGRLSQYGATLAQKAALISFFFSLLLFYFATFKLLAPGAYGMYLGTYLEVST